MPRQFLALSAALLFGSVLAQAGPSSSETRTIRWVVAHDRGSSPFLDLNKDFAKRLEEKSGGALKIEFIKSDAPESRLDDAAFSQVAEGKADVSQLAASYAGVHVLDMPFLFRSYDHAEAVFASPAGQKLVASISETSKGAVRGIAFTYSGGYRILAGDRALKSAADFKNAKVRRTSSFVTPFLQELGATPVEAGPASREKPIAGIDSGAVNLEETEINRLAIVERENPELLKKVGFVNLTRHRMYTTAIVANEKFLASLPESQRKMLIAHLEELAVAERKLSVDMEGRSLDFLAKKLRLVNFPKAALPALMKAGAAVEAGRPDMAAAIAEIRAVKEPARLAHK